MTISVKRGSFSASSQRAACSPCLLCQVIIGDLTTIAITRRRSAARSTFTRGDCLYPDAQDLCGLIVQLTRRAGVDFLLQQASAIAKPYSVAASVGGRHGIYTSTGTVVGTAPGTSRISGKYRRCCRRRRKKIQIFRIRRRLPGTAPESAWRGSPRR